MKLHFSLAVQSSLLFLAPLLIPDAQAATVARDSVDNIISYTPEQWDAKWNAWPRLNATTFAERYSKKPLGIEPDATPLEICTRITGCVGTAAATASGYAIVAAQATASYCSNLANTISNEMQANNYALAKQVLAYTLTEIALPLLLTVPMYYINVKLQNAAPQSKDDACGVAQTTGVVEEAGAATYGFCMQLQQVTQNQAFSRVDFGTVSSDNTNDDVGLDMAMRMLISTVKGKYLNSCSVFGVELKRAKNPKLWI